MGVINCPLRISSLDGQAHRDMEATVDTGSGFTVVPTSVLQELGVVPVKRSIFELADGSRVEFDVGEARVSVNGDSAPTFVVFGADDAAPLLGAVTMQLLEIAVGPYGERLVPRATIWH